MGQSSTLSLTRASSAKQHVKSKSGTAQRKLSVLLIENDKHKADALCAGLDQSNYSVNWVSESGIPLLKLVENSQPDIVIIDIESPNRDMLESLNHLSQYAPKPVVMFSEQDSGMSQQLIKAGVSAYVVGDTNPQRVRSILDTAIARFSEYQSLKQELDETKAQLDSQKTLNKAKSWLMEHKQLSEQEAYHSIRKMAMNQGQKMEQVAKNILSVAELLKGQE